MKTGFQGIRVESGQEYCIGSSWIEQYGNSVFESQSKKLNRFDQVRTSNRDRSSRRLEAHRSRG
jgi:hypothetical protein